MKFLKYLLIILGGLIGIYFILCATGDAKMETSQSIVINASAASVFEELVDFDKVKAWSPWVKMDPAMTSEITGKPGNVGHKNVWKSKALGDGSQELVELRPNEFVKMELKFVDWDNTPSYSTQTLSQAGEGTKLIWAMDGGAIPFMMRGMMTVMGGNKMLAEQFNKGLADLKALVESKPKAETVKYEVVDLADKYYIGQLHNGLNMETMDPKIINTAFEAVMGQLGKTTPAGNAFCIGRNVNFETKMMDLEMCMPVANQMAAKAGFTSGKIPAGRCAKYVYIGPYEGTPAAWDAFMKQLDKDGLKIRWDGYEEYINSPETEPDPAKLITWLMVPVE